MSTDANSVLMGAGVTGAKIDLGLPPVAGTITAISEPYQEREYIKDNPGGGQLKTFPSGDPIMSFSVDVSTGQIDASIEHDDGVRRIYMDGARIKRAVREAVKAAGARGLAVGGWLSITCVSYDEPGNRQSGKNYTAQYVPGAPANNVLMDPQAAAQQASPGFAQQAVPQQPYQQQPTPAPQPAWNPQTPAYASQPAQQYAPAPQQQPPAAPAQSAPQAPAQQPYPQQQPAPAPAVPAGPTPEQIAAVRAAGMDPAAVFPGFTG